MRQNTATVYLSPEQELASDEQQFGLHQSGSERAALEPMKQASIDVLEGVRSSTDLLQRHGLSGQQAPSLGAPIVAEPHGRPTEKSARAFSKKSTFEQLADLIANMTESYTVLIFEADHTSKQLRPFASHTLSRDVQYDIEIGYGSGLVGWTAENRVRISVCPFERDATTLLYYSCDQALKSFIAVPVLDVHDPERLVGVIACDSKKSYAYSKLAEKVLLDCAEQAAALFELFKNVGSTAQTKDVARRTEKLADYLEGLRKSTSEQELLTAVQQLPQDLVESDAVVVVASSEKGMGHAHFYPSAARDDVEHRLLQIVCKHKKLKTHGKSVHSLPLDDKQQRSFLSIPVRMLDGEVGSLNLLSQPKAAFTSETIALLESLVKEVGLILERLRLRELALSQQNSATLLAWPQFKVRAEAHLKDAAREKRRLELLRISFGSVSSLLEDEVGLDVALATLQLIARLIEQVAAPHALCGRIYANEFLLLVDAKESAQVVGRFQRLLQRLRFSDVTREMLSTEKKLSDVLTAHLRVSAAEFPKEAKAVSQLLRNCHIALMQKPATRTAVKE